MAKSNIYTDEYKKISDKLIQARRQKGLTQNDVARKMRKTQSYISKVESCQLKLDVVDLKRFAQIYEQKLSFFVDDEPING